MHKGRGTLLSAITLILLLGWSLPTRAKQPDRSLKDQRHLVEFGFWFGVGFPSTKHNLYSGNPTEEIKFQTAAADIGLRLGYLPIPYFGIEFEAGVMPTYLNGVQPAYTDRSAMHSTLYTVRGQLLGQIPVAKVFAPFIVIGAGMMGVTTKAEEVSNDIDIAFHWGVGFKWYALDALALRVDLRHLLTSGYGDTVASHVELLFSFSWVFRWATDTDGDGIPDKSDRCPKEPAKTADGCPVKDSDGDGIPDNKDACPNKPAKTANGCPPKDTDGDGVPDTEDKCPTKPAQTADGCPLPPKDTDGDGVPDAKDACPNKPAKTANGCPAVAKDTDGDGVPDNKDKCPNKPAKTADGCPPPDRDGDGIPDDKDKCPDKPETKNGYKDDDGCPDKIPRAIRRFTGAIRGITFKTGKDTIQKASFRVLGKVVRLLKKYPNIKLLIEGHTDDRGKREANIDLSKRRADAVKAYLVSTGIDTNRLQTVGHGPDKSVASNRTRRGRSKNRRIEFKLVQ